MSRGLCCRRVWHCGGKPTDAHSCTLLCRSLGHQLRLTGDTELQRVGERVMERMGDLFEGISVKPSILHGDLWSGNISGETVAAWQWRSSAPLP